MLFIPFDIVAKVARNIVQRATGRVIYDQSSSWLRVREPYTGAWQRNDEIRPETVLAYHAVYACVTLIASDVGKLRIKLVQQDANGIWSETSSAAFSPVLRKPNSYQNRIQFVTWWITSKLLRGNTYVLKERDNRGVVVRLYILDPQRVTVLVAPDGSVFYRLQIDNLSGITGTIEVPASELIHDLMNPIFHPLCGTSPIFACGRPADLGLQIEQGSATFFGRGSNPSGTLEAPNPVSQQQANEISERWNSAYSGNNAGKVAVLGNGLKFTPMRMSSVDAQLIEQQNWSAQAVASAFHVPAFKIGAGAMPTYNNAELLNQGYYSDCLQSLIESFELCLDEGLGLGDKIEGRTMGTEFDLDGLLRMDTATQYKTLTDGIGGTLLTPNEARKRIDLPPLEGGDTVYMQQQDFSLAALAERDRNDPFSKPDPPTEPTPPDDEAPAIDEKDFAFQFRDALGAWPPSRN